MIYSEDTTTRQRPIPLQKQTTLRDKVIRGHGTSSRTRTEELRPMAAKLQRMHNSATPLRK